MIQPMDTPTKHVEWIFSNQNNWQSDQYYEIDTQNADDVFFNCL